ncbi:CPBP family glutamic-type intramembrane protease [Microseira wollei]|uniref:CPBP family glutamic-type intramembrane protease n=1 Tax=Microseira wollei TaxID=467598 RepID=UPI001CFEF557|nr:CPBP family glutamic-type intramembrane protease [Microseira wollei]
MTVISLPIGFYQGFLQVDILKASRIKVATIIGRTFFFPGVSEELFVRVLLLPHPSENASISAHWLWACISLAVFIVYHPLNALSFFPAGRPTFFNPVFLLLAALLGIVCTIAYLKSGSLWLPVAIHWLVVVVWLLLLGGYGKLNSEYIKD